LKTWFSNLKTNSKRSWTRRNCGADWPKWTSTRPARRAEGPTGLLGCIVRKGWSANGSPRYLFSWFEGWW
jgi:hypothetical protein